MDENYDIKKAILKIQDREIDDFKNIVSEKFNHQKMIPMSFSVAGCDTIEIFACGCSECWEKIEATGLKCDEINKK